MRSGAGSMSTLSIVRAAILAVSPGRTVRRVEHLQEAVRRSVIVGQGCLHPLKRHRIACPQIDPPAVTGKRQGLWQGVGTASRQDHLDRSHP